MPDLQLTTITLTHPVRDARAIHRAIEHDTHGTRTLWAQPTPTRLVLRTPPGLTSWAGIPHARSVSSRLVPGEHPQGAHLTWSLIGNACRTRYPQPPGRPRPPGRPPRVAITDPDDALAWLHQRLDNALRIDTATAQLLPPARGKGGLLLTRWAYAGTGTVTDPQALAQLLRDGVGRGKAFGCGLLLTHQEDR